MSYLADSAAATQAQTQLPASWYFDTAIHERELKKVFPTVPRYVGHELMVPEQGDYQALDPVRPGQVLIRNARGVQLLGNVCRHRQAILLEGRGSARNIVCPLHRWTYGLDGKLLGAPLFPEKPCLDLPVTPLQSWNGLLFEGPGSVADDLGGIAASRELDFSGYRFDRTVIHEYAFNWKTFIEVYLEDYHVVPFHPGLGRFVDVKNLRWEFGNRYSLQTVGLGQLDRPGSEIYRRWSEQVMRYAGDAPPAHGAIWVVYYPNVMIEAYPWTLVVSTVIPRGPEACTNVVEFYYQEEIALFEPEFVAAEQAAYLETAVEDEEICRRMTRGRRALVDEGRDDAGPYQDPTEIGMAHFHRYLRRQLEAGGAWAATP